MAHRHRQAEAIADLHLYAFFPCPRTAAVAATRISQQQEVVAGRPGDSPVRLPPGGDGVGGERWRVARGAEVDKSSVVGQVIHPIWHRSPQRIARKVVHVDRGRSKVRAALEQYIAARTVTA